MIPQRTILRLLVVAIVLPIVLVVTLGTGRLLAAMGDDGGSLFLTRACVLVGIGWIVDLIVLLAALAVNSAGRQNDE